MNSNLAGVCIEGEVRMVSKRWPFLNQVVSKKAKVPALRIDGGLIMNRAIFEVEYQVIRDPVIGSHLDQVALRDGATIDGAQCQKAVDQAFDVAHGYRRGQSYGREQARTDQYF